MKTCWLLFSVIAALAEASDLLSRCPSEVPRNQYLKATEWGKCYQFHMEERTWRNANFICGSRGGHLVTIKEEHVQNFLLSSLAHYNWPRNGLWIGATDQENEMDWKWITGERVKDGYSRWASGQPSCGFFCFEDCAVMRWKEGGRWHDYRCNWLEDYSFICEYDMDPEPTTTSTTSTRSTSATTTTTTTETTTSTTTTTPTTTLKSLESEYLVHHHHEPEDENKTTALVPPAISLQGVSHARTERVQGQTSSSPHIGSGTLAALIVSLLTALSVGVCCLIFLLFRRRRRKQFTEEVGISYANPYYGEVKTPLATAGLEDMSEEERDGKLGDADDGENVGACGGVGSGGDAAEKGIKLKISPAPSPLNSRPKCVMNPYDCPPSLSTHKPVTMATVTKGHRDDLKKGHDVSLEEENHYDEIPCQHVNTHSTYDVPRASLSHRHQENFYYDEEENLYESVDNLRAMVDQRRRLHAEESSQEKEEESRYVPFVLDSSQSTMGDN